MFFPERQRWEDCSPTYIPKFLWASTMQFLLRPREVLVFPRAETTTLQNVSFTALHAGVKYRQILCLKGRVATNYTWPPHVKIAASGTSCPSWARGAGVQTDIEWGQDGGGVV